jgi:putative transcriptional regulator
MLRKIANYAFQNNLQLIRESQQIPLCVLANRIGISRQALSEIEKNNSYPSLVTAAKLAWYFNMKIEEIFQFYVEEVIEPKTPPF